MPGRGGSRRNRRPRREASDELARPSASGREAVLAEARRLAAIVMPCVFTFADKVTGDPQAATSVSARS